MFFSCENLISELTAHPATYIFDQNWNIPTRVCVYVSWLHQVGFTHVHYTCALKLVSKLIL